MLWIVGLGPGDPGLATARALEVLARCRVVAGWRSVLARVPLEGKEVIALTYADEAEGLRRVAEAAGREEVALVMHGDPSVSEWEFMAKVRALCRRVECRVVPGVSAVNALLAAVGLDLAQVAFLSLHARDPPDLRQAAALMALGRHLVVFPPPDPRGPQRVAAALAPLLPCDPEVAVAERLTMQGERLAHTRLSQLAADGRDYPDLTAMVIYACGGDSPGTGHTSPQPSPAGPPRLRPAP